MKFTIKTHFDVNAKAIYTAWLSSDEHTNMTGGEAFISDKEGIEYSAWDGYIKGKNLLLEPYHKIIQSWRTTDFDPGEPDSTLEIQLRERNGKTELTLIHSNLSESGHHYKKGWREHYFEPMKDYFSGL